MRPPPRRQGRGHRLRHQPQGQVVTLVQSDNDANGELVGAWLATQTKGKDLKIALLSGDKGNVVGQARRLGVFKGLVEGQLRQSGTVKFEVVAQGWGGWTTRAA